jgi:hypothetical protein
VLTQAQVIEIKCTDGDLVYPTINIILKLKDGVPTNGFDWICYCLENGNFFLMGLRIGRKEGKKGQRGGGGGRIEIKIQTVQTHSAPHVCDQRHKDSISSNDPCIQVHTLKKLLQSSPWANARICRTPLFHRYARVVIESFTRVSEISKQEEDIL